MKIVNIGPDRQKVRLKLARNVRERGEALILTGSDPLAENSFDAPKKIAPAKKGVTGVSSNFIWEAPPWSASILRLKTGKYAPYELLSPQVCRRGCGGYPGAFDQSVFLEAL